MQSARLHIDVDDSLHLNCNNNPAVLTVLTVLTRFSLSPQAVMCVCLSAVGEECVCEVYVHWAEGLPVPRGLQH